MIRRTFNILILPQNFILGTKTLYKLVDNIWYLAGDKSTDYNYYTKRSILASIYIITLIRWLNDESKNLNKTEKLIKKLLNKTSYIPKIKNKLNLFINRTLGNNKFNN